MDSAPGQVTELRVELGDELRPSLVRWTTLGVGGAPPSQGHHAYALSGAAGVVLIDPEVAAPHTADALQALLARMGGPPVATVLTSSWHERWAYGARERYGAPVWAPLAGRADLEGTPDRLYDAASPLPGELRALDIGEPPGGDTALLWQAPGGVRVLFAGDLVMGSSAGSGRGPDHWRYAPGMYLWLHGAVPPEALRARFRRLLDDDFDRIYSAHGLPVPFADRPQDTLAAVVETGRVAAPALGVGLAPA
jgi:glyoxylase-like metal-dependent hydrolase (beta-lactamase superfamily II)